MSTIINGTSSAITFPDSTVQNTALTTNSVTKEMISTSTANGMGICRAWVTFVGSTGAVSASYNVSSVTRGSAGGYVVNFTTAMPDANFCTQVMFQPTVTNNGSDSFAIDPTTTKVDVRHYEIGVQRDGNYCCVVVFR